MASRRADASSDSGSRTVGNGRSVSSSIDAPTCTTSSGGALSRSGGQYRSSEVDGLLAERLDDARLRRGRLVADDDEGGELLVGVLGEVGPDVVDTFLEEEPSASHQLKLDLSHDRRGVLPAAASLRLRQSAQTRDLLALSDDHEAQVLRPALGRRREDELRDEVRCVRTSHRNPPEPRHRHVHDGSVRRAAEWDK